MTFGSRLTKARENKGYKQSQFAEMLGITATRLNYWEKDKREPDVFMIKKISKLLEVSSDWLICNDEFVVNKKIAPIENDESDKQKYRLISNYEKMNKTAQNSLVKYSDFMVNQPENLKNNTENTKMNA